MKKIVAIWLCVILIGSLAACSAGSKKANEKVTLSFSYWDEGQKVPMDKSVEEFQKENPNIKIVTTIVPWAQYWTKLQISLPTSSATDIFWVNPEHGIEYNDNGLLLNLATYMKTGSVDLNNFPQSTVSDYSKNGNLFAIPKDVCPMALYYNKSMFDNAKVSYPDKTWTWQSLLQAAEKLTIKDSQGKISQYGFIASESDTEGPENFILQNNGTYLNKDKGGAWIDTPANVEAIQFMADLMFKYKVSPTGQATQEMDEDQMFMNGKVAMLITGSWMLQQFKQILVDKFNIAPLPKNKIAATSNIGLAYAAAAKTKNPDAAWKFLDFLASKKAQEYQAGVVIPAYKGAEGAWYTNYPNIDFKVFVDGLQNSYPTISKVKPAQMEVILANEMSYIWTGSKDVKTAMADAEKELSAIAGS